MNKLQLQILSFWVVGIITTLYCFAEFGAYIVTKSLTLLSDGFHNFSDVIGLLIAYWAVTAAKKESSDEYSYGWARAEILGGLINGSFLLSLCMYIALEAIPKFIHPDSMDTAGSIFIYVASAGVAVNTFGTVLFAITGTHGHSHAGGGGHGHSHGGGDHGHSHSSKRKNDVEMAVQSSSGGHGHSHGGKEQHAHAHGPSEDHGHGHGHGEGHGHSHGEKEKHGHGHGHGHSHSHGAKQEQFEEIEVSRYDMALQDHDSEPLLREDESSRRRAPNDHAKEHAHAHSHSSSQMCFNMDMNTYAVFIHYLGDMFSSVLVLIAGLLIKFFGKEGEENWTSYVDPTFSLIIVVLVLYTTFPLLFRCSAILMQSTPAQMNLALIKQQILQVPGVLGLHDFHVWQLVDELTISSVHVTVEEGSDFMTIASNIKEIYHHNGIHSTAVQPEFVPRHHRTLDVCEQNCVEDCEEDWCCKKTAEKVRLSIAEEASRANSSIVD